LAHITDTRIEAQATPEQKSTKLSFPPTVTEWSWQAIDHRYVEKAPGTQAAIGGLKVVAENGWFAARPSEHGKHLQNLRGELKSEYHMKRS